jgi:hypothetical protein
MKPLGARKRHFWLLQGMLRRSGADAVSAFAEGDLTPEDWAALVESCRACSAPCACRAFLDDPTARRENPPPYCRNAQRLAELPRRAEEEPI